MKARKHIKGKYYQEKKRNINYKMISVISAFVLVLSSILLINSPKDNVFKSSYKKLLANNGIYTEEIKSIDITSDDYDNPGSFKIAKEAKWLSKDTAQLELEFDSKIKADDYNKDIVLVFDTSASMIGNKLDSAKNDIANLIEYMFNEGNNKNNHLSIITFNTTSQIISQMTNNKDALLNSLDSITAEGRTNYNAGLSNVDAVLEEYGYVEKKNTDLIVLFVVDGYPNVETPTEVSTVRILKEKYPNLKVNSVQLDLNNKSVPEVSAISDAVFNTTIEKLGSAVMDAAFNPDVYENLEITDVIDDTYFDIEDVTKTKGETRLDDNKVIWNLDDTTTGSKEKLTIKIKVKDRYKDEESYFPTNKKTTISTKLIDKEKETITSNDTPVLKNYYDVTYDVNTPSGCNIESIPTETHIIFDKVQEKTEELVCAGYHFKGWQLETNDVRKINNNTFLMPAKDVVYRATWAKQSIAKSMDGAVHLKPTLYNVFKGEALYGSLAKEYTGEHADAYDRSGNEKVYYWSGRDYQSILNKNNVIFANHCWQMLRTTDTGGVKLLYYGEPDDNGSCNSSRGTHVGYNGTNSLRLGNYYYYGTDYTYDKNTKTFKLAGDKIYEKWSDSTYETLLGKYTCKLASEDGTCSTLYYIESYDTSYIANVILMDSTSHYSQFGEVPFNINEEGPTHVGYMYNDKYIPVDKYITNVTKILSDTTLSTGYYYADSYDYGETTASRYTLTNPYRVESTSDFSSLVGKYTLGSSSENYNDKGLYYIVGVRGSTMYYIYIQNGQTVEDVDKTYTFGDGYIDNGDGTYTLSNPVSYKQSEWYDECSNVTKGMYTCLNDKSICQFPFYITYNNIYGLRYLTEKYVYGNSFKYELNEETGKYEYVLQDTIYPEEPPSNSELQNHHYTCLNNSEKCESVKYIFYKSNSSDKYIISYITLMEGKNNNDALNEMFYNDDSNAISSTIKKGIDAWYKHYMIQYDEYLEDTVFCNDRSIIDYAGWKENGNFGNGIKFKEYNKTGDILCSNETDRFSTQNEKAKLSYPVGLPTFPELWILYSSIRVTDKTYWTMSPYDAQSWQTSNLSITDNGALWIHDVDALFGVRPSISLKPGIEYSDGNGSKEHPYIIDTEGD